MAKIRGIEDVFGMFLALCGDEEIRTERAKMRGQAKKESNRVESERDSMR